MISYGPSIVTSGLQLYLDAGNLRSYPGTGTTWADISANKLTATLVNAPTFNSSNAGYFSFNGSTQSANLGTTNILNFTSAFSVAFWYNANISTSLMYFIDRWTYGSGNFRQWSFDNTISNSVVTANAINFRISTNGADSGATGASSINSSYSTGWHFVVGTWDGSNMNLYVDGILVAGPVAKTSMVSTAGQTTYIGVSNLGSTGYYNGSLSIISAYNRALSAAEVAQNFNAHRGRYGI